MENNFEIKKICSNCVSWEVCEDENKGICINIDEKITGNNDTCDEYSPDPSRFCTICNSKAKVNEHVGYIFCLANVAHYANFWDYEWMS